jgi:hypothetical protein
MKNLKTRLENLVDKYAVPALLVVIAYILFLLLWYTSGEKLPPYLRLPEKATSL